MWQSIELREIRVFLVLAEELHFGRTAVRLGLTQSRVSQTLRALERKVGVELAHRTSRRVALTAAGERFRDGTAAAVTGLDAVLRSASDAGLLTEPVRIGVVTATSGGRGLAAIARRFEETHPSSCVEWVGLPFRDRFGPIRRGEVEVMVGRLPLDQPDLVTGPLLEREAHLLAVAADHVLAAEADVSIEVLAEHPCGSLDIALPAELVREFAPPTTPGGRPIRRSALRTQEPSELIAAVARGRIVQPVSATFAQTYRHPDVVFLPIRDLPPSRTALVWRRRDRHRGLRAFLHLAQTELRHSRR